MIFHQILKQLDDTRKFDDHTIFDKVTLDFILEELEKKLALIYGSDNSKFSEEEKEMGDHDVFELLRGVINIFYWISV